MHVMLGVVQLDAGRQVHPAGARARLRLVGTGAGNLAPQVALAEPGQRLAHRVTRAADPRRQQVGAGVRAGVGDIAQLGAQDRIGQRAGRLDPRRGGFGLGAQRGEFRVAGAGEFQQAFDVAADRRRGFGGRRRPCPEKQQREQKGNGTHDATWRLQRGRHGIARSFPRPGSAPCRLP